MCYAVLTNAYCGPSLAPPLPLPARLRHPCQPEEEDSTYNIHKDVHPHEPKVPPDIIVGYSNSTQEHIGVAKRTEATGLRVLGVLEIAGRLLEVWLHVFAAGHAAGRAECHKFVVCASDRSVCKTGTEQAPNEVSEWADPVHLSEAKSVS